MADTQAMPALVKALSGVLPSAAIRSLMQALGNCNQPQASRAPQAFQPPEQLGNNNGVYAGRKWNPASYPGLLPPAGSSGFYDVPSSGGWHGGDFSAAASNVNTYGGNSFFFPTNQEFGLNNYYGGPVFNVGGNTAFENINTTNITTQYINGNFVGGGFALPLPQSDQGGGVPGAAGGGQGFPGGGGVAGGGAVALLFGQPNNPLAGEAAQFTQLSGDVKVDIPTEGVLTDDCRVRLTVTKPQTLVVKIRPPVIRTLV